MVGLARGSGFLIARLPSEHPTLVKWSAPCFVSIRRAVLLLLGRQPGTSRQRQRQQGAETAAPPQPTSRPPALCSLASLGLSLGFQRTRSFTACMRSYTRLALYQRGGRAVAGLEASLRCGGLQHKADLIAVPAKTDAKTGGWGQGECGRVCLRARERAKAGAWQQGPPWLRLGWS